MLLHKNLLAVEDVDAARWILDGTTLKVIVCAGDGRVLLVGNLIDGCDDILGEGTIVVETEVGKDAPVC